MPTSPMSSRDEFYAHYGIDPNAPITANDRIRIKLESDKQTIVRNRIRKQERIKDMCIIIVTIIGFIGVCYIGINSGSIEYDCTDPHVSSRAC